ncbi:MAG: SHOCT domain-containing protein [Nitrospirae bacterium]|nr:MAG: SHOCT domain-containing protein [Nitrospirota bacterium]
MRLEAQPRNGREEDRSFSHPVTLSPRDWEQILSLIRVKSRAVPPFFSTKTEPEPAFRESELHYLAEQLADTFTKAGSRDWIVFYLGLPHETGATEITSEAFFVEETRIHLLFANFRHLVTIPAVAQQLKENPLHAAGALVYEVVLGTSLTVLTENRWALSKPPLARVVEVMINEIPRDEETGLEAKLRTLKRLHAEGLISEDQYQRKREESLKAL